jgi:hypothetical protein
MFGRLRSGNPVGTPAFSMVPLTRESASTLRYEPLTMALAAKTLTITEVSATGSVPEVRVMNHGALPVLLLDGAALVGAKQNRIINLTVLVPAKTELLVPVSCVEQGRWRSESREFSEGKSLHFAAARAQKLQDVSVCMERTGARRSDQGKVWADMACYQQAFAAAAPSGAMDDVFSAVEGSADKLIDGISSVAGQVGAAFLAHEKILGMDLFDSPLTFGAEFAKIVRSYAVEVVRQGKSQRTETGAGLEAQVIAEGFMRNLAAGDWKSYQGVGLGTDLRSSTSRYAAGALAHNNDIVHLVAFPGIAETRHAEQAHAPAMPRFRH